MVTPPLESTDEVLLGSIVDARYRIVERVGVGGMAAVYRALQTGAVGREVAFKVLHNKTLRNQLSLRRFENEAQIIAQLRHPHTLKLVDSGRLRDGRLYLVTEFLVGESLERRLLRGRLSPKRTLRLLDEVAESLAEAHALGLVHRDLKPANVFLEKVAEQQIVRVLDFGIAKLVNHPGLTLPEQVFGTPGYMAPEQARGEEVDSRADIYSLGVIAFECLSGRLPTPGTTPDELMINQASGAPRRLRELVPPELIGAEVIALVDALIAPHAGDRPRSIAEVRERIARAENVLVKPRAESTPKTAQSGPARWVEVTTDREILFDDTAARDSSERTIAEQTDPMRGAAPTRAAAPEAPVPFEVTPGSGEWTVSDSKDSMPGLGPDPTPHVERKSSSVVGFDPAMRIARPASSVLVHPVPDAAVDLEPRPASQILDRRLRVDISFRALVAIGLLLVLLLGALLGIVVSQRLRGPELRVVAPQAAPDPRPVKR